MEIPDTIPCSDLVALHDRYREIKHSINNSLAVIMALSELAQRNPVHYEKLTKAVLSRGPDIVAQMQDFQQALLAKINPGTGLQPAPPSSGIF